MNMKKTRGVRFGFLAVATLAVTIAYGGGAGGNNAGSTVRCADRTVMLDYYLAQADGFEPVELSRQELLNQLSYRLRWVDFDLYTEISLALQPVDFWRVAQVGVANDAMLERELSNGCRLGQVSSFIPGQTLFPTVDLSAKSELSAPQLAIAELHEAVYMTFSRAPFFHTNPVLTQKLVGLILAREFRPEEIGQIAGLARGFISPRPDEPHGVFSLSSGESKSRSRACPASVVLVRTGGFGVQVSASSDSGERNSFRAQFTLRSGGLVAEAEAKSLRLPADQSTLEYRDATVRARCVYERRGVGVLRDEDAAARNAYSRPL